ncbi:DUF3134 domain-containing protein [Fortiea sp. LEGE XX443]|uniref:DUF3134 domain-containing protein n=1 Tax=Fortiea sp. LEGE XX443 TaxID=1828611 RepID=UPI001880A430|nr:DUF3134 domain-containing protein [Fortiea sp. LEGE XX443]MBE9007025.1 DUF3134 domain-containing protein [Fortiea sp. LEGE XX443]
MVKLSNPALHEEPRYQPAAIIPLKQEQSLLDWLASTGRLEPYVFVENYYEDEEEDEEEEVVELINTYEYEPEEIDHLEG